MRAWPAPVERRARIEIIPMIDVMMFLLVFFVLISINVLPALGLKITPPTSGSPDKIVERVRLTVGIDGEGQTFLDGVAVPLAQLPERVKAAAGDKGASVIVTGDQGASLQNVVSVMDALKIAGVSSIQLVTRQR
jgi:biopolymer transport protein ExbD